MLESVRGLNNRLDLNTVSKKQLTQCCGLTKLLAERIIERRKILTKFTTIEDLLSIQGISSSKLRKLRTQLAVYESRPPSGLPTHAQQISFLDPDGDHICEYVDTSKFANISDSLCSKPGFIILHVNAASSSRSLSELRELLRKPLIHFPDIICVSDTGKHDFELSEYERYSFSAQKKKPRGKGVAIYVNLSSFFKVQERFDLTLNIDECDNLWLEIKCWHNTRFVIGVIYRNPRTKKDKIKDFRVQMRNTISQIKHEKKVFYILGDLNLDMREQTNHMFEYCQMLARKDCSLLITRVTREVEGQKPAILDHIYTNSILKNVTSGVIKTLDVSDHYPVYCLIDNTTQTWQNKQNKYFEKKISELLLQPTTNQALKIIVCFLIHFLPLTHILNFFFNSFSKPNNSGF